MTKISKTNQDLQAVPKGFTPINGSKLNSVALSCINIALVAQGAIPLVDGVTPLGHELNSKGGIIDLTILSGPQKVPKGHLQGGTCTPDGRPHHLV